ncbi:MAG TPA: NAD(P)/FAD-dependent oxidoreductase, partial [Rudaea sp.]|nr:NAD(P)/FAD-dependent oxidoreductase [Rudaea sp.]
MSGDAGEDDDFEIEEIDGTDAPRSDARRVVVIGGGPAGLMAAEVARAAGADVQIYDRLASPGRKFLIAGKGGLNLTHAEGAGAFLAR